MMIISVVIAMLIPLSLCDDMTDFLSAHNSARASVNVGDLVWSTTLADYAQLYADNQRDTANCAMEHSLGPYGENIAWASYDMSPIEAVNLWVAEKQYYDYASNSCIQGYQCLHYTQVVWSGSTALGCASSSCTDGSKFIICSYNPPGNVVGDRPY